MNRRRWLMASLALLASAGCGGGTPPTPPGLTVEILKEGSGPPAQAGDRLAVTYVGHVFGGGEFERRENRDDPFEFKLGNKEVIKGWDQGLVGMRVGEKRKLRISSDLAYGAAGNGEKIPAYATLIFEIELVGIK